MRMILTSFAALLLSASAAFAAVLPATPNNLVAVLLKVRGGDTIRAAPGVYSGLMFKGLSFSPAITITSADPARRATFTGLEAHDIQGVTFANLEIVPKPPVGYFIIVVVGSKDVHFDHVSVHGSLDGDPTNDPAGIHVAGSSDISITNSEFQQLKRGLVIDTSSGVTITGNHIHDLQVTGMMFATVSEIKISHNTIHDIFPIAADHPDAVQFFTTGQTQPSKQIEVSGNLIFRGAGRGTQGIFLRDQVGTLPYQDVTIMDNLIVGTGYGGILVMGAKGLTVTGNELVSHPGATNNTWILVQKADQVIATDNRAQLISFDTSTNVTQKGNSTNSPVKDGGAEVVARWAAKPGFASVVAPFAPSPANRDPLAH